MWQACLIVEGRLPGEHLTEDHLVEEHLAEEHVAEEHLAEERLAEERLAQEQTAQQLQRRLEKVLEEQQEEKSRTVSDAKMVDSIFDFLPTVVGGQQGPAPQGFEVRPPDPFEDHFGYHFQGVQPTVSHNTH